MRATLQPLRDEHQSLLTHVEDMRAMADVAEDIPAPMLRQGLEDACRFLRGQLIPHLRAEERGLYPRVERLLNGRHATELMRMDHGLVLDLVSTLARLRDRIQQTTLTKEHLLTLRRVLYGLHTIVPLHFSKVDALIFSLLEPRLSPLEVLEMYREMDISTSNARD